MSKKRTEAVFIDGPVGRLEALIDPPDDSAPATELHAVVCHPHPQHAGTMHNKVAHMLARSFARMGIPAVRFNFRGVGASEGEYDEGRGETEDALAVLAWAAERWPGTQPLVGGFSFGAFVALRVAARLPLAALVTVAPAVHRFDASALQPPACPWLLIQGDADEIVPVVEVREWVAGLEHPPIVKEFVGAGHFFHGRLTELRETVVSELGPRLGLPVAAAD